MRPAGGDPDGDPRLLHRTGLELAAPEPGQTAQPLVEPAGAFPGIDHLAVGLKLSGVAAAKADAQDQPPAAEEIERHGLPGHLLHPAARQRRDHRSEPDPLGPRGDRAERHPGVGHGLDRRPIDDVIPEEQPVPAA
jgi:hypothetical protein